MEWLRSSPIGIGVGVLVAMALLFVAALIICLNVDKQHLKPSQSFLQWSVVGVLIALLVLVCNISAQASGGK